MEMLNVGVFQHGAFMSIWARGGHTGKHYDILTNIRNVKKCGG